ncbi:MAG: DUF1232 domain-containing protein [Oscillospiraceae bacterium]|nr:DUF1232 domain-containing protein [Oscillospiraceae bacterium]
MSKFKNATDSINQIIGAMYIAIKRDDTPLYAKLACGLCVYYVLSPLDIVPDFIPVLGAVDDVAVLPFLIWLSVKLMPDDIMEECMRQTKEDWQADKKKRYMLPVLAVWLIILLWAWHLGYKLFFAI